MLDVLEHLPDAEHALRYAVELLEPNGMLLVTVPAFRSLWTKHDDLNMHFTRYTKSSFRALASRANMRLDEHRYFFHWLFPLKLAVRAKERFTNSPAKSPLVPPAALNQFFYGLSRAEQLACRFAPLPLGSSLLAVGGRKVEVEREASVDGSQMANQQLAAAVT